MEITTRALWTMIHGMGFGALYLLACSGALVGLSKPLDLKLVSRIEFGSGAVAMRYEPRS